MSYLLPGSRQTERHWYCNLCENTNVIDEFGDIVDAPPLPQTTLNYGQGSSSRYQHKPLSRSSTSDRRTLCDSCQRSQIRIYQYLSDYLSDENDPNYSKLLENADSYQQSLHEKNPLCDECQKKVQDVKSEQRDTMRRRRLNEQRDRSLHTKTPIRLTKKQYYRHGFLFVFLHSTVFVLCILVYFWPPRSLKHEIVTIPLRKWLVFAADFISTLFKVTDEQPTTVLLSTMSTLPEGTKSSDLSDHSYYMKNIFGLIATEILNLIDFVWNVLTMFINQLLANNSNPGLTQYSWDATDMGILCWLSFYALSFFFMGWHSRASRSFSVAKGLKSYHVKDDGGQTQHFFNLHYELFLSSRHYNGFCIGADLAFYIRSDLCLSRSIPSP
ncbi:hypothetical protein [Absidia glauca]|uniref:Ima1 N-terminal domain-containing protein n=1 Tax=Absidia glauca TaxID=4829 RepID=A0A168PVG0_ABSGL|nr:hypothetical protein [Absidia glauca]